MSAEIESRARVIRLFLVGSLVLGCALARATTITIDIDPAEPAGTGFADPTPVSPLPDNPGTTLGAQRLYVFTTAANQWAKLVNSPVTIRVLASMVALTCGGTTATLGSAGPQNAFASFPNAPKANTFYAVAEANSLAGSNLSPGTDDIKAQFNVNLDNGTCLTGTTGWYYGTTTAFPVPANRIPLLPVVFHELGHGLGFISFVDPASGADLQTGVPDIWSYYLYDLQTGSAWTNMSDAQRVASAINDPNLVWAGKETNRRTPGYLKPYPQQVLLSTPTPLAAPYPAGAAQFGPAVTAAGISGRVTFARDVTSTTDGCSAFFAFPPGDIALVDRGNCNFTQKTTNAQAAGASALLVANNQPGLFTMSGTAAVTIPSLLVTQELGTLMKNAIAAHNLVNATLSTGNQLSGTKSGCIRMFAPPTVEQGSSVSHFHSDAYPALLMQPVLNETIFNTVDLTLPLFRDIGWSVNSDTNEDQIFFDGFEPNPCGVVQP